MYKIIMALFIGLTVNIGIAQTTLSNVSGTWFDRQTNGLGFNIIETDRGGLMAYFYGYQAGADGNPLWLITELLAVDNIEQDVTYTLAVSSGYVGNGGSFNTKPNDNSNGVRPWGSLALSFSSCTTASARLVGIDGEMDFALSKLANLKDINCSMDDSSLTKDFPTLASTGPRYASTATHGSMTTTTDGQIIEGITINGSLDIRHNNVTVRDVTINGNGTYALDIGQDTSPCPSGIRIEYSDVNMANAPPNSMPIYSRCGGAIAFDHIAVYNSGRALRITSNTTITNSFFSSTRTWEGAHRAALSTHGGSNFVVKNNTFICELRGCSSAVNMYSDDAPVTDYLFAGNLLATTGAYCLRGGASHNYPDDTANIRIVDNAFSTRFNAKCGQYGAIAQFDTSAPGNISAGNYYHESGELID